MDELGYTAVLAWIIPFIVSLVKRRGMPAAVPMALAGALSLVAASIGLLAAGTFDVSTGPNDAGTWLGAAGLAFTEANVIYRGIFGGTVVGERLDNALTEIGAPSDFAAPHALTDPSGQPARFN